MSRRLVGRSPDLQQLEDEGYYFEITSDSLKLRVPYVTAACQVEYGYLVSELTTSGDSTDAPSTHVVSFVGANESDIPCDNHGKELADLINQRGALPLSGGLTASCTFSHKPNPTYTNYYEKMSTYASMLLGYAQALDPNATATPRLPIPTDEDESVFRYFDSATSRARIGAVTDRLRVSKVVIVGLGGTGSYILDLVAKTPVGQIHLYDGDKLLSHNAFRAPGAASLDELMTQPMKVDYWQAKYDPMRRYIYAHPVHVDESNIEEIRDANFVFLAVDSGPTKKLIISKLIEFGVGFVDTGVGVYQNETSLGGMVRTTAGGPGHDSHLPERLTFADEDEKDEYEQNIQIADLNMLNASLAVIRWKKQLGFYLDFEREWNSTYTIDGNHLLNEDQHE